MVTHARFRPLAVLCLVLCLTLALPTARPLVPPASAAPRQAADWTFMVYASGDNNLEPDAIDDFLEMSSVGSDAHVNIVMLLDRIPDYDDRYGDWTDTKRFVITPGMTPDPANGQDLGELNMGDPQTVVDFVDWARGAYTATHYALVFWNHGSGWAVEAGGAGIEDVCFDDTDQDSLTSAELYQALDAITGGGANPIDLVGFDACLMAMWEVDNQVKPFATAVGVSSEESIPLEGWPYDTLLADLEANPTWSPAQFGPDIVQRYYESYPEGETLSAKDLGDPYTALNQAVDGFALALIQDEPLYYADYDVARAAAQHFGADYVDLYDLAARIGALVDEPGLVSATVEVREAIDAAILLERHGPSWPGAHGITIYFPTDLGLWDDYHALRSSDLTHWDEFLYDHINNQACDPVQVQQVDYRLDGLTLTLTPTITGEAPISITWSFGDGATSTVTNPLHTFSAYGTYTVALTATNCAGRRMARWSRALSPVQGCGFPVDIEDVTYTVAEHRVSFDSTVAGGEPLSYRWSFGDGQSSTLPDPVHVYQDYGTYTVTLVVSNCGGLVDRSWQAVLELRHVPCVLLVDDDGDLPDLQGSYTSTLAALGVDYEVWDVLSQGDPGADALAGHRAVVWYTGLPYGSTFNGLNEAAVSAYLDAGGNLLLSSEDYLYDYGLTPFGESYLGVLAFTSDTEETVTVGMAGDPVGEGLGPYTLTAPAGWDDDLYTDEVSGTDGMPFTWQPSGMANSTSHQGDTFKTVFLAWPLEALADVGDRAAVLGRVLDWFGGCAALPQLVVEPPAVEASLASGAAVTRTFQVANGGDAVLTFTVEELTRTVFADVPWLAAAPLSGTLQPGHSVDVVVTLDAGGLGGGTYLASLGIASNDPQQPQVNVPVTLTVLPSYRIYLPLVMR